MKKEMAWRKNVNRQELQEGKQGQLFTLDLLAVKMEVKIIIGEGT